MSGAIDLDACTTRRRPALCWCLPKCTVCGYGPHVSVHGPLYGQPPGSRPCGHEYQPPEGLPEQQRFKAQGVLE